MLSDAISRQAAIDELHQSYNLLDAEQRLEDLSPVQPERKKGKWITDKYGCVVCSEYKWNAPRIMTGCLADRHLDYDKSDYCWHCGADMRGK